MQVVRDWVDPNVYLVLNGVTPVGYIEQVFPKEWKAFDAAGNFKGWFNTKAQAIKGAGA